MSNISPQRFVSRSKNKIFFFAKINAYTHVQFMGILKYCLDENPDTLIFDFSKVKSAYPDGMIPIINTIDILRRQKIKIKCIYPYNDDCKTLFIRANWAHLITPEDFQPEVIKHEKHLIARRFVSSQEQQEVVNDFVKIVLSTLDVTRSVLSGLEWSINEITDNVLNHSGSSIGGIIQVSTYPKNGSVSFAVGDSGRGILTSLKEAIPTLRTDLEALGEAVKSGVTRNNQFGQGNGLAGTLRIATMTGGSFSITSGQGYIKVFDNDSNKKQRYTHQNFIGTLVCADIKTNTPFNLSSALEFEGYQNSTPVDIIETNYETESSLLLLISKESTGFGNRGAGKQLRQTVLNLLKMDLSRPIELNWSGIPLISSSFADEFLGKLFLELGPMSFGARIRNTGMETLIRDLLEKAITQRLTQAND
ncbi:STAS-like domain-containing protein [Sulfurospirillum sp. hDNRA2]|uniref:STAS-like domain-containing protein n=1 Tax=Sulfurospirillum sp. hDNRA2 TaxID=3237298 RepID=UPI0020B8BD11|nr:DUF4325 domain-containing protein [Sulfurospirillum sp. DNRA8]MCP3653133.1 DUF4325 domain-containing protein [Sulfurospirillum sp. DNRA8]MCR1811984.1 DUF4325 domain-containing protein [Sulfurospirillum sp. DNRA8]